MSDTDYAKTALLRAEHPLVTAVGTDGKAKVYEVTIPITVRVWAESDGQAPDEAEQILTDLANNGDVSLIEFIEHIIAASGGSCDVEPYTPEVPAEPVPEDPHHVDGTWVGHGAAS